MSQLQVTGEAKIRDIQGPVVANSGVITALDGAASQYVRGDGTLADFPTSTGGGSSVSYYLNSSVSQGTIGGVAYRQLGKTPIAGAGTDIAISANGYVASYLTDANDPALLEVPAGNFNCEFYFSVNNNTGDPFTYAEVYKYDGTTFTLLGTSVGVPEYITEGTVIKPYYFAIPVAQSVLTVTDRIAIRIYVNVDGRTVTLHTENNHLCQVVTTFSKGLISLNNLTRQNQFFATGTSGTDFGISSSVATHTFNLPVASATNTGKLSSTDWSTFNNKQAAGNYVTLDTTQTITAAKTFSGSVSFNSALSAPIIVNFGAALTKGNTPSVSGSSFSNIYTSLGNNNLVIADNSNTSKLQFQAASSYDYTFPAASGTLALTSDISYPVTSVFGRTGAVVATSGDYNTSQVTENTNLYFTDARSRAALSFSAGSGAYNSTTGVITIPTNNNQITNGSNFITLTSLSAGAGISYNNTTGAISSTITQYTDALARAAISLTTTGTSGAATYNSTTGVLNVPNYAPDLSGYVPTSRTITINGTSFDLSANRSYSVGTVTSVGLSSATSGVTIGSTPITTSGTITLAIATASGSQNGLLSSTDWTTFNNKQNALTNPVTGTGTTNYLPKFTGASTIGNSIIFNNGSSVGINTITAGTNFAEQLQVSNTDIARIVINRTNTTGNRQTDLLFSNDATTLALIGTIIGNGTLDDQFWIRGAANIPMTFYTNSVERMRIFTDGNLLLQSGGTFTNAGYKLDVNGTGRFSGNFTIGSDLFLSSGTASIVFNSAANFNTQIYQTGGSLVLYTGANPRLTIASSGAATFSSSLTIGNTFNINTEAWVQFLGNNVLLADGDFTILQTSGTGLMRFRNNSAQNLLTLANNGTATFNSNDANGWYAGFSNSGTNFAYIGATLQFANSGGTATDFGIRSANAIAFYTSGGNERMRITSAGLVGIGTVNSFLAQLNVGRISAGATTRALSLYNNSSNVADTGVAIEFYPNTGNDDRCAKISSVNTTTVNNADLRFFTSNDAAPVERMRITSAGVINTTSRLNVNGAGDNSLFSLNTNGTLYTLGFSPNATASTSTTLTITTATTTWIYNGSGTATWTLPNPSGTNQMFWIKNAGTGVLTLNAFSGTNIINNSATAVSSITIAVGATALIQQDGNVKSYQLQ
jgi:hypothetical protein